MEIKKVRKDLTSKKKEHKSKPDFDDIDLGDADNSSGNLGMDNFKCKDEHKLPSEKGRIEEL